MEGYVNVDQKMECSLDVGTILAQQTTNVSNMSVRESHVDVLMQRIEAEVLYRRDQRTPANTAVSDRVVDSKIDEMAATLSAIKFAIVPPDAVHLNLPTLERIAIKAPFQRKTDGSYHLNDFLPYDDAAFVHAAFWAVLQREVDADGLKSYLAMLRDGASKVEILGRLRESPEGRLRRARIDGLSLAYGLDTISRWPVIGRFVGIVLAVLNLPNAQRNQRRFANDVTCRLAQTDDYIAEVGSTLQAALETLEKAQNTIFALIGTFAARSGVEAMQHSMTRTTAALYALQAASPNKIDREQLSHELRTIRAQIETKAAQGSVAAVSQQIQSIAQLKSDRSEVERLAAEFGAALNAMGNAKANSDEVAAIRLFVADLVEGIAAVAATKADDRALQAVRMDGEATLKAAVGQAMEAIRALGRSKADQSGVDALKRESIGAIEQARVLWNQKLDEIAKVVKDNQGVLQAVREEGKAGVTAATEQTMEAIRAIALSKADQSGVDALKQESMDTIEQARVLWNQKLDEVAAAVRDDQKATLIAATEKSMELIRGVAQSKADQSGLDSLKQESMGMIEQTRVQMSRAIETKSERHEVHTLTNHLIALVRQRATSEELNAIGLQIESLNQTKADHAGIAALKADTEISTERAGERLLDALRPVISRAEDLRHTVLDQERRIGLLLEEARKRFPRPISSKQIGAMLAEEDHQLDAMYASFEDQFRGTRADIRQKQSIYLPYIRDAKAGRAEAPVVDLGCGRGEWLELLASEGLTAQGADRNRILVSICRELNLDVQEQDAVTFLRQLKPNSIGAVTSFQLIEHLVHRSLIALIDEALRVLVPGGIVIFETPNPRNLIVAGCNFYLDPTHHHPLPPDLSRYLLEARGFCSVVVKEIHPFESEHQIVDGDKKVKNALNQYLFSAQDYAVIGRKA